MAISSDAVADARDIRPPVALVFDMGSGSGQTRPLPAETAKRDRPWRKPAAEVAAERRCAASILGCSSADGGVHFGGLEVALRAQEFLDRQLEQAQAGDSHVAVQHEATTSRLQAATTSRLQAATTGLLQAATNGCGEEEVQAALAAVQTAFAELSIPLDALVRDRAPAGPSARLQLMHLIAPRLWVGGWAALNDGCSALRHRKITHVVSILSAEQRRLPPFIVGHHHLRVDDREAAAQDMAAGFSGVVSFMDEARRAGGTVYVHCGAGISRAPTAAAAYLIWRLRIPAAAAVSLLRRARPCVRPNVGFVRALKEWEARSLALAPGAVPASPAAESLQQSDGDGLLGIGPPVGSGLLGAATSPDAEAEGEGTAVGDDIGLADRAALLSLNLELDTSP
jgi:predicted protein tyrosine phosphatase